MSLQRISAPLRKMIFEILCILSVIIGQMVNIGTGIHRIEVKFVRLRERLTRRASRAFAAHFPPQSSRPVRGQKAFAVFTGRDRGIRLDRKWGKITMPNRRVVTKSVAQPLFANKSNGPFTTWQTLPLPYCAKADKASSYFPLCSESDAEESHLSTTALLLPFARRRNFMHFASHDRIFTIGFLLPSSASSRWFTAKSCTTRLFCTSYHLIKLL